MMISSTNCVFCCYLFFAFRPPIFLSTIAAGCEFNVLECSVTIFLTVKVLLNTIYSVVHTAKLKLLTQ